MKILVVVRHAKSDWGNPDLHDKDRTLNERGSRDAPIMAKHFADRHIHPQLLISSTATRAWATAERFIEACAIPPQSVQKIDEVYEASVRQLLQIVNTIDDKLDVAMLVGHNPGVTDLVRYVTDDSFSHMPTCGVAIITFTNVSAWQEVSKGTGLLSAFLYPKQNSA